MHDLGRWITDYPSRINVCHNQMNETNLLFADGHAQAVAKNTLFANPSGSYTAKSTDAELSNLRANSLAAFGGLTRSTPGN